MTAWEMMGHSGTVPSAILAEEVSAALNRQESVIRKVGRPLEHQESTNSDDEEPVIGLRHRALPLFELLEATKAEKFNVMRERD